MLRGFHLANNGNITDEHLDWLQGVEMVKCLVRLDLPAEPTGFQRLHESLPPHTEFVLRLYMPGRWSAEEFVQRTQERLPRILSTLEDRTTWIEIHNEPNHKDGIEGWGRGMEHVTTFIPWYHYVIARFRCIGFQNLGFPGLALGNQHWERVWARECKQIIEMSDWVGVHSYWQDGPDQMFDDRLGWNWSWYQKRFPGKRLIVTEAGNSNCHSPNVYQVLSPEQQADQYLEWCKHAEDGPHGVCFFMLGGTQDWAGFQVHKETIFTLRR